MAQSNNRAELCFVDSSIEKYWIKCVIIQRPAMASITRNNFIKFLSQLEQNQTDDKKFIISRISLYNLKAMQLLLRNKSSKTHSVFIIINRYFSESLEVQFLKCLSYFL